MPLLFSTPLHWHIYTHCKHSTTTEWHILLRLCRVFNPTRPLFTRGNVFICEGRGGGGGEKREKKKEREVGRERKKKAGKRKETENRAIWESGSDPNHCPQSPGTCLTASFCNGRPELLPQTTGLWNHTQKHSSHQGQMHPYGHK